jgi:isoamylase
MADHGTLAVRPGEPRPLGATYDGFGTNFTVFSEAARAVELCLFDANGAETRVAMPEVDGFVWHVYLPGVGPGTRYGYRVHGPWDPDRGWWCNPAKLLADPYARMFDGDVVDHPALRSEDPERPGRPDERDSAPYTRRSLVVAGDFDWEGDRPPRIPFTDTVLYEAHVKGLTVLHPEVSEHARGTYLGVADPAMVDYYHRLGVTAVELLPVHQSVSEPFLVQRGLVNYWGYNTFGFFAPHRAYGSSPSPEGVVGEFKTMVRELHRAQIEVILDVVYNHTAEGPPDGPTYSLRGLDNRAYYRVDPQRPRRYIDTTGVGNSLNMTHPASLRLVMDSLRYWVTEMHVDGFRFDLAATLAREGMGVDRFAAFFDIIAQDPVLSRVKLIAEPWDLGPGGYQVGNFPPGWLEWNGMYRDTVRDYWRGRPGSIPSLATRLAGSSDLYGDDGRHPWASVNFVTAHDGFTLRDLVSYSHKHNEANLEDNRDGSNDNRSSNHGVEGPTDDPVILATRARQQRTFLATLLLAQGIPMLLAGDERHRTQGGNNNAYAQDNPTSWIDWTPSPERDDLVAFTTRCTGLRREHPVFRRRRFLTGLPSAGAPPDALPDVLWLRTDGLELRQADWGAVFARSFGMLLNGDAMPWLDPLGGPVRDDSFLLLLNAWDQGVDVTLPGEWVGAGWTGVLDTTHPRGLSEARVRAGEHLLLAGRSMVVLRRDG